MALDPRLTLKANESASSTTFDEVVPTLIRAKITEKVRENSVCRDIFETIKMPSAVYNLPYQDVRMTVGHVLEHGDMYAVRDSPEAKEKTQLTARKLVASCYISTEVIEDAVVDIMEFVTTQAAKELMLAEEDAFINGDITTYPPASSTDPKAICDGIRILCASNSNNVALTQTPITLNAINTAMANVETDHYDIGDYVWMMHPKEIATLRGMDEFEHADKFGGRGSIANGFQGKVYGIPVIQARTIPSNLGTGTNETVAVLAHKLSAKIGQKRSLKAYQRYEQQYDRIEIQMNERIAFNIEAGDLESFALVTGIVA